MKNRSAIAILFTANSVSSFAQGISMLAIPWFYSEHGMSSFFVMIYAVTTMITLFWSPIAGNIVDQYNRYKIFLGLNLVCGLVLGGLTVWAYLSDQVPVAVPTISFMITMLNYNIHFPALYAFLQEIIEAKDYGRIASIIEITSQVTGAISGALAAILISGGNIGPIHIAKWDMWLIIGFDALTYFLAFALMLFIRFEPVISREKESGSPWEKMKQGYTWLKDRRIVYIFGIASFMVFATAMVELFTTGPQYVNTILKADASVFALSDAFYSLGAILAGAFIRKAFTSVSSITAVNILTLGTAIVYFTMVFAPFTPVYYLMLFFIGITNAGARVLRMTYLFETVPNQVIGRVNGFFNLINILIRGLLLLLFCHSFFHEGTNINWALVIMAFMLLFTNIILYRLSVKDKEVSKD